MAVVGVRGVRPCNQSTDVKTPLTSQITGLNGGKVARRAGCRGRATLSAVATVFFYIAKCKKSASGAGFVAVFYTGGRKK